MPSATDPVHLDIHPPSKANLKAWWAQFTSNQRRKDANHKDGMPLLSLLSLPSCPGQNTPSSASLFRKASAMQVSKYQPQTPMAVFMSGGTFPLSLPSGKRHPLASSVRSSAVPASGLYLKENGTIRPRTFLSHRLILAKPPKSRAHFESTAPISECENCRQPSKHLPGSASLFFFLQKTTTHDVVVWQRLGLETRELHYARCGKRVPQIPHPDACQYLFGPAIDLLTVA